MILLEYLPILLFMIVGLAFGVIPVVLGKLVAPNKPNESKLSQYECGFEPFGNARLKFDIRFYLVAILFIIFDLEIAFLFPWAIVFPSLDDAAFWAMMVFLGLLVIGFAYEWLKGALEWE